MTTTSPVAGYLLAAVQAVLYACMGIIGKYLYGTGLTPEQVMVLRFVATFAILGVFLAIWRKQRLFSRNPLVYVQGAFFMGSALLYFLAVDEVSAGLATALLYAYPAVVALLSTIVFRERLTTRTAAAVALALGGIFAISGIVGSAEGAISTAGILYGVGSCIAFAIYTVIGQKVIAKDTILPVVALLAAIKIIGATKAALISIAETPISLLLAYLMFGETLTALQGIGCALIVASIFVVTMPARKGKRSS